MQYTKIDYCQSCGGAGMGCPDCESGLVETNDEASPAEQAGWSDFYKGKDDNPYPKKSTAAQDWKFGWDRAWRHENGEDY